MGPFHLSKPFRLAVERDKCGCGEQEVPSLAAQIALLTSSFHPHETRLIWDPWVARSLLTQNILSYIDQKLSLLNLGLSLEATKSDARRPATFCQPLNYPSFLTERNYFTLRHQFCKPSMYSIK
ncbi:hypothetical protein AVEN_28714-1 [Araneus ventricosus]|uniref:Uncharacterized protein n=1 Tax=Araneus ventricosus TaxID=182803 RepID=A0A4Y2VDR4_ARAVE|nr:hypothetical protein AVEN_28714-1 [Araneus ventricosus]